MMGPQTDNPNPPQPQRPPSGSPRARNEKTGRRPLSWTDYLRDPRSAVLSALAGALLIGGGRKIYQAVQTRRALAAIAGSDPAIPDVEAAADHRRAGLIDLFRLLTSAERPEVRAAAGRALTRLWKRDELVAEEEKAIVRRGFTANWLARRKYPRNLAEPIPIAVDFGVPFLINDDRAIGPEQLSWSYRIFGTERAGLEAWTEAGSGLPRATFLLFPTDFATLGPHRLTLQARVKTVGLRDAWELDLPHLPFAFEFDPNLTVDALLTLPDATRASLFAAAVRLVISPGPAGPFALTPDLVLRDPLEIQINAPLPCDLAHRVAIEIEGIAGTFRAGQIVVAAGNLSTDRPFSAALGPVEPFPPGAFDRPGSYRVRVHLTPDASLGWTDPAVRSVWPVAIQTDWVEVRVSRR